MDATPLLTELQKLRVIAYFARHLVSIYYVIEGYDDEFNPKPGLMRPMLGSGFVMELFGDWFYMTAGHIVNDLNRAVELKALRVCRLLDSFGWEAECPDSLVLGYGEASGFDWGFEESTGHDYGVIALGTLAVEGLKRNKIIPVGEEQWKNEPEAFERYWLLGTPAERASIHTPPGTRYPLLRRIVPVLLNVEPVTSPPVELVKPYARFYGKIAGDLHIGGMSGGPLLGFQSFGEGEDVRVKYWATGVQSGWQETSRVIAACPFREFATGVKVAIEQVLDGRAPD